MPWLSATTLRAEGDAALQRITFRSCRLLNNNGELVIFPNTFMLAQKVANHSTHPATRIVIPAAIPVRHSVENARRAMLATTDGDSRVRTDPPPEVVVSKIADTLGVSLAKLGKQVEAEHE